MCMVEEPYSMYTLIRLWESEMTLAVSSISFHFSK